MKKEKNFPKIGETFYWIDEDGDIHDDICYKIEKDPNNWIETMYYTYINPNGGGTFITESDLISSSSKEVQEYKKQKAKEKVAEIAKYISQDEVYSIIYKRLNEHYIDSTVKQILNILTNND